MLTLMMALTTPTHAAPEDPIDVFEFQCELNCNIGGWRIEIQKHPTVDEFILDLIVQNTVYQFGSNLAQASDTLIAENVEPSDGYCVQYPNAQATAIIGNVYQRTGSSPLSVYGTDASTPPLIFLASQGDPCEMDIPYLLDVIDEHKEQPGFVTPDNCEDSDCLWGSGGGVDPQDPGSGFWTFTNAANDQVSFDDPWNPGSGENPVDVEEHLEDKQPETASSGNNGNSGNGNPHDPIKEEAP